MSEVNGDGAVEMYQAPTETDRDARAEHVIERMRRSGIDDPVFSLESVVNVALDFADAWNATHLPHKTVRPTP